MKKKLLIKINNTGTSIFGNKYISGIGRSELHLLREFAKMDDLPFDIQLYASGSSCRGIDKDSQLFPYFQLPFSQILTNELTKLEHYYVKYLKRPDLLHIPHNYDHIISTVPSVVTIHDTCQYDDWVRDGATNRNVGYWREAAQKSLGIVTCSQSSKNDIVDRFKVPEKKVEVIPWGVSTNLFHKINDGKIEVAIKSLGITCPYFLAVSCAAKRKNIDTLLKAFKIFAEANNDVCLVLVWGNPPKYMLDEYSKEIFFGRIKFLDFVTDNGLTALYNGALATMFPSRYEGFGFPILESYACGTPVMTCRNSSLPEIGGELATYVGEDAVDEMVDSMVKFSNSNYKQNISKDLMEYSAKYTWEETAKAYVNFYTKYL